jgi:integrase
MPRYSSTKARLTKRQVDAATPNPDADLVVWDTEVPDFRLRVRPSGRKSYELRYQLPGSRTPRQIKIGDHGRPWTPDEARDEAKRLLRQVHDGSDPLDQKAELRSALTVDALINVYLVEGPAYKPDKRSTSWEVDRYNLHNHLRPLLGKKLARDLTKDHLVVWQDQVANGATAKREKSQKKRGVINITGGPGAAAKAIRCVAAMLEWARERGHVSVNVARDVKKIQDGERERYLQDDEAARIWNAIDDMVADGSLAIRLGVAFKLILLTGARVGEIRGLRWSEIDLQRKLIFLPPARHKSGGRNKPKSLELPLAAVQLMKAYKEGCPDPSYVFPAQATSDKGDKAAKVPARFLAEPMSPPYSQWDRVMIRARVSGASFHVLRHTFASQVMADNTSLLTLSKMLGHARVSTTQRYAHLAPSAGAKAADRVAMRYEKSS